MNKSNYKYLIPFIFFIFMCMLIYTKFAIINVNALTLDYTSSLSSSYMYDRDYEYISNYGGYTTISNNTRHTPEFNSSVFKYKISYIERSHITPYSYITNFSIDNDFNNFVSSYSTIYANVVLHFRLYYDIRNDDYWNPYRELYNNLYGSSTAHESGSGSYHGGGGISFDENTSGDYTISGEEKFYRLSFFNEDLDLYNISWGFTSNDNETFADIYAYYSGNVNLSVPVTTTFGETYGGASLPSIFKFHLPFDTLIVENDNNRQMTSTEIVEYFGSVPNTSSALNNSYFEISKFEISNTHEELSLSNYYDEDSCLSTGNCGYTYSSEDESFLGILRRILSKIIEIGVGILAFPQTIFNAISNAFSTLGTIISNGIASFFLPPEGYLQERFQYNFNLLKNQLGFLFTPFELIAEILNKYQNLNTSTGIIHIPNIVDPIYNTTIIHEQNWNLREIFEYGSFGTMYNLYLNAVDVFLVIWLVNMFLKKFNSIFSGDGEKE